jgi:hypothetical protein
MVPSVASATRTGSEPNTRGLVTMTTANPETVAADLLALLE